MSRVGSMRGHRRHRQYHDEGNPDRFKDRGDFPMDIPDDLEVNTVTASGTVKASNGEFDTVTVRGENATAKLTSIGVVVSAPSNAYVNTISPNLLDLKRRENSIFYLETSQINNYVEDQ